MKGEKLLVTMKDIKKYRVLKDVIEKRLYGTEVAQLLNLSVVHVSRLKKRLLNGDFEGLLRRPLSSPPDNKISEHDIKRLFVCGKNSATTTISCILWTKFGSFTSSFMLG